ncbi:hypothetical protein DYB30_000647 [Aphanomyces astaci]|uniref:WW domain-containing protein n=1 Tax=Aphanomyces astaci TaxID=112090 RepID=A0A397DQI7_APHAT|nr:hypothetical protein DYB30_000647 [Aphanomyces astaci]RHY86656.1 hypothetical protein DYB26_000299 [Aphanomyces astaci]
MTPPVPSVLAPPLHPIELLDHLLGTLLLVLSLGFVLLVELTRRRVLSLHQLTFCLASAVSTLTIGGFVEHNVPNDVLDLALFGYYTQTSTLLQLRYAPLVGAVVATVAFLVFISLCSPAPEPPLRGSSSPRSSNKSSLVQRVSPVRRRAATERDSTPPPTLTRRRATPVARSPTTAVPSPGDMSGLISSESESDDDVIVPSAVRQFTSEYAVANRLVPAISRGGMPRQDRQDDVGDDNMPSPTSPWVLCYDEATAAPYYYCHATGESRWELPETSVGAAAPVHSKWSKWE